MKRWCLLSGLGLLFCFSAPGSARAQSDTPSCEDGCKELAAKVRAECIAAGVDAAPCSAKADELLRSCLANCSGPPPPPPCEDACKTRADRVRAECLANGGGADACDLKAAGALKDCLGACQPPPPPPPSCE